MLLGILAVNSLVFLLPQYLQLVRGVPAMEAGLWMLPLAAVSVVSSLLTPRAAGRFGRPALLGAAGAVGALACLALTRTEVDSTLPLIVAIAAVAVLGATPTGVLGTDLVVGSVPPERAGSAAAVSETAGELGAALSVATAGTTVAAVYGAHTWPERCPPASPARPWPRCARASHPRAPSQRSCPRRWARRCWTSHPQGSPRASRLSVSWPPACWPSSRCWR
jgi:DHA2 family multidrug resistance protein-like MFS transporter